MVSDVTPDQQQLRAGLHDACQLLHRASAKADGLASCNGGLETIQALNTTDEIPSENILAGS